jgi:hypothetical protein
MLFTGTQHNTLFCWNEIVGKRFAEHAEWWYRSAMVTALLHRTIQFRTSTADRLLVSSLSSMVTQLAHTKNFLLFNQLFRMQLEFVWWKPRVQILVTFVWRKCKRAYGWTGLYCCGLDDSLWSILLMILSAHPPSLGCSEWNPVVVRCRYLAGDWD